MKPRNLFFRASCWLVLVAAASFGMYAGACGTSGDAPADGTPAPTIDDVIYEGLTSDEALLALLAKQPSADPAQGTVFDTPMAGQVLPASAPATFAFHVGGATGALHSPGRPSGRPSASGWDWLRELAGPIRTASAHGPPVNGRAYFLVFSTADNDKLVRVFTTNLSYTPDAVVWQKLGASQGSISVTITNAIFENNRIAQEGGPFAGQPVTFSVGPSP